MDQDDHAGNMTGAGPGLAITTPRVLHAPFTIGVGLGVRGHVRGQVLQSRIISAGPPCPWLSSSHPILSAGILLLEKIVLLFGFLWSRSGEREKMAAYLLPKVMSERRRVAMCGVGLGSDPSPSLRMTMRGLRWILDDERRE